MMASLMAVLGLDTKPFKIGLEEARHKAESEGNEMRRAFGEKIGNMMSVFTVPEKAIGTGVEMIKEVFKANAELAEQAKTISVGADRIGVSAERYQQLARSAKEAGIGIDSVFGAYKNLAKAALAAEDGDAKATAALQTFGVEAESVKGKSVDDIFTEIAKNAKGAEMTVEQVGSVMALFGKNGDQMLTALKRGSFAEFNPFALSSEAIESREQYHKDLEFFGDAWTRLKDKVVSFGTHGPVQKFIHAQAEGLRFLLGVHKSIGGNEETPLAPIDLKTVTKAELKDDRANEKRIEKEREAGIKELQRVQSETHRLQERQAIKELTAAEKVEEVQKRIRRLKEDMANSPLMENPLEFAKAELELTKQKGDLAEAQKEAKSEEDREKKRKQSELAKLRGNVEVTEHERIGAFAGSSAGSIKSELAQSRAHLAKIEGHLAKIHGEAQKTSRHSRNETF